MPIRIELFAKDIKSATEVVEYALSMDCALVSYTDIAGSSVGKSSTYDVTAPRKGSSPTQKYKIDCSEPSPFTDGSIRDQMYLEVKANWPKPTVITRQEFNKFLRECSIEATNAASIYKGFQDKGVLTPV